MTEYKDVVVVGGGQAGLAAGWFLARTGLDFEILEAAPVPAAAWRGRWDSLRLFTPVRHCGLPGRRFPGMPDRYPHRDDVVAYLTDYARDLPVSLASAVRSVRATDGAYEVELDDRLIVAAHVIVATGPFQVPRVPSRIASLLPPDVDQLHSAAYRRPQQIADGRPVLVVGAGNTGCQIAEELARTHDVHLAVGSRQARLPQRILGRDVFSYLDGLGLVAATADSRIGRRMQAREPALVGTSPAALGVPLHPRVTDACEEEVVFEDRTLLRPRTVIWATGYDVDHSWIDAPIFDSAGRVIQKRGTTPSPGLHVLGLPWMHTRGSALLGWVGADAEHVVVQVAARAGARQRVSSRRTTSASTSGTFAHFSSPQMT